MKSKVYLETTIVSYLTARPSRDPVMHGLIGETKAWWEGRREAYELWVSDLVMLEASQGDPSAARRRQAVLRRLSSLRTDPAAQALAASLVSHLAVPPNASADALHIALAAVNRLDFLLTWNCRHIANAEKRPQLEALCQLAGFHCPIICTPLELMGT